MRQDRFKIYTEDKGNIEKIASEYFDNCTIIKGVGIYESTIESCAIIEVIGDFATSDKVVNCAEYIKLANKQECVLVTREPITTVMI